MLNDLRFAMRSIARTPVSTTIVVLTLAVGIAGATAIASVANAMLVRSFSYPDPDRLVIVGREPAIDNSSVDIDTFNLLRDRFGACEHIAARTGRPGINMTAASKAEYVTNNVVTAGYFEALGVVPVYGRSFRREDEQPGGPRVAIIDSALAQRVFGSAREAVGHALTLGSETYDVVGVLPPFDRSATPVAVWLPLRIRRGGGLNYTVTCRLKQERTLVSAATELSSLQPADAALYTSGSTRELARQRLGLASLYEFQTAARRPLVSMLAFAVGFVLLVACANSAWLFSARAFDRRGESAVRVALGASHWRVMRQILSESVLLTLIGGALGIVIAVWALPVLLTLPPEAQGWQAETDAFVIGSAVFVSVAAGGLCGLLPAFKQARLDPIEALQTDSRRVASGRSATAGRRLMVFGEVALCMVLLVTSGLFIRCVVQLQRVEVGFDPANVLTAQTSMADARYADAPVVNAFYERVLQQVQADPRVESAAVVTNVPIDRGLNLPIRPPVPIEGQPIVSVDWRYVTEDYFRTMRIALRQGRQFTASDQAASAPVAIVNDAFVKRYFPDGRALGMLIEQSNFAGPAGSCEIVGVVADTQQQGLTREPPPTMYVPATQVPARLFRAVHGFFPMSWVVRYRGNGSGVTELLSDAVRNADPRLPISRVRTMENVIDSAMAEQRMQAVLLTVFGLASVLMAITALAGSVLYAVMRRKRDIGVRLALGADAGEIVRWIVGENVVLTLAGIAAGIGAGLFLREALEPFLFGIESTDLATYLAAALLLFLIATAASLVAAMPVLRIDPAKTLRAE